MENSGPLNKVSQAYLSVNAEGANFTTTRLNEVEYDHLFRLGFIIEPIFEIYMATSAMKLPKLSLYFS